MPVEDRDFYKSALEHIGEGMLMIDPAGSIVWSNPVAASLFAADGESLNGHHIDEIMPESEWDNHAGYLKSDSPAVEQILGVGRYVKARTLAGRAFDLYLNVTQYCQDDQRLFVALVRDVSLERELLRSVQHRSSYDFITQLYNRDGFVNAARNRLATAVVKGEPMWLGILNVSGVGKINHWIGYEAGDLALHEIGFRLTYLFGPQALIGRVDGNEFAILLPKERAPKSPQSLSDTAQALGYEIDVGGRSIDVRFACGGAYSDEDEKQISFPTFFARARTALREARLSEEEFASCFYNKELDRREQIARTLENELVHALARDEFFIEVQPKVCMNRRVAGYEALLRWRTPDGDLVPPGVFIPIAEANGTIRTIGVWVFQQVCRLAAEYDFKGKGQKISVNLSPRQMESGTLPDMFAKICSDCGADPASIELEVTEGWAVKDYERGSGMLQRMKEKGFEISLDDFGTGYSSLGSLVRLPVDTIKVDRSLLPIDIQSGDKASDLLTATINLCRAIGREVLVEGVENEDQFQVLVENGCDLAQGYLFGRPRRFEDWQADMTDDQYIKIRETV